MNFANIPPFFSPVIWLDMNALDHNIAIVNQKTQSKKLRIASKSVRSIEVLKYIADKTPNFIGIMSYDALESQFLLENGFDDVLCAYPQMNELAIKACEETVQKLLPDGKDIKMTWMIDNLEHWQLLEKIGKELNQSIRICIDVNMSSKFPAVYFGTQRSSINNHKQLKKLLKQHKRTKPTSSYTKVVGLMGYEAQIAGLAESAIGKEALAPVIRLLKTRSKSHVSKRRKNCVQVLNKSLAKSLQPSLEIVNGGGSGSMDWTCASEEVTEITVGSAYYLPAYFSYMDTMQAFQPAMGFVLPVTRKPFKDTVTCQSGGFIASGSMGKDKQPIIHYPKNLQTLSDEGFGEVQTPIKLDKASQLNIGDNVWFRHAKAGELCEHFNEIHTFRDGKETDTFLTYRGQGKCFH
ncbi:MAG: amino acid aldolase [Pseudomonadales bacterium]|nr:MAG: amino acid aldolase [Pseudomonadales bacterium]